MKCVIDVFDAAGIKKLDISILDNKFMAEIIRLPQKNFGIGAIKTPSGR
jgi:type I restriction enzyme, R subunit